MHGPYLKTHDLWPGSTPMMGQGIHPLCRRAYSWLRILKMIFSWPGFVDIGGAPTPTSTALVQGEILPMYEIHTHLECHGKRKVLAGTPCSLPQADSRQLGGVSTPLYQGSPWDGGHHKCFFAWPLWAKAGFPPPTAHNWVQEETPFQAASMILPTYMSKWDD